MERETRSRLSDCGLGANNGLSGGNISRQSLPASLLVSGNVQEVDRDDEIERPRREDSRASLIIQQLLPDLAMLLPSHRFARPQDPLLSSTMVQDPAGQSSLLDAAAQDWPNASSILLGNSNSGHWGNNSAVSVMEDSASDPLNNAGICLDVSTADASAPSADSGAVAAAPSPAPTEAAGNATSEALVSVSGFNTDSAASSVSGSATSNHEVSSPRLRVLASDGDQLRQEDEPLQQPHQNQLALGLLQVCRLTLDVLSEGGLLRDEARRWLTPELLCDKLCDRIYCPMQQPGTASAAPAPSAAGSSIAAPMEFESPVGRVRHWLLADGNCAGGEGCRCCGGEDGARRHVTNSV